MVATIYFNDSLYFPHMIDKDKPTWVPRISSSITCLYDGFMDMAFMQAPSFGFNLSVVRVSKVLWYLIPNKVNQNRVCMSKQAKVIQ